MIDDVIATWWRYHLLKMPKIGGPLLTFFNFIFFAQILRDKSTSHIFLGRGVNFFATCQYRVFYRLAPNYPFAQISPRYSYFRIGKCYWLEIFTSDRYWPYETICKISSQSVTWFAFYRPVSILPKMLIFCITTCPISLKFWQQARIINT